MTNILKSFESSNGDEEVDPKTGYVEKLIMGVRKDLQQDKTKAEITTVCWLDFTYREGKSEEKDQMIRPAYTRPFFFSTETLR